MKSKRRRISGSMNIVSGSVRHGLAVVQHMQPEVSREAKHRLKWFDHYRTHGNNASLTCRYFGISRQTFYRWKRRYQTFALQTLENRPCTPKRRRQPSWTTDQVLAVQAVREQQPVWGKAKLQVLLARQGIVLSVSMVGRILKYLRRRGVLHEPPIRRRVLRFQSHPRPYAVRKPKGYLVQAPGDLVEIDTVEIHPLPGAILKQFTSHDVISRWNVLDLHNRATALTASQALDVVLNRMPFPVRAIQIDGGSEFMGEFEVACREHGLPLFVLPPRSPKLNGGVERANRTHRDEFYACTPMRKSVTELASPLRAWELTYNTVRPHQALSYLTPLEFLERYHPDSIQPGPMSLRY